MKKQLYGHIFCFLFQMFGAIVSAEVGNYVLLGWCTGWATYSIIQIEKLARQIKAEDNMDIGD